MSRLLLLFAAALAAAAIAVPAALASMSPSPVAVIASKQLGKVLATRNGHLALYTWNREKDHRVHCTGACQKTRSAPQKQPRPTTATSSPSGNGGAIGVPSTSCAPGTCIASSRPGSASSAVTIVVGLLKRNMPE